MKIMSINRMKEVKLFLFEDQMIYILKNLKAPSRNLSDMLNTTRKNSKI